MEHIRILSPPVKRARSTSTSAETPEEELERLRVENAGLKDEIFALEAQLYAVRPMVPAHHLRKSRCVRRSAFRKSTLTRRYHPRGIAHPGAGRAACMPTSPA